MQLTMKSLICSQNHPQIHTTIHTFPKNPRLHRTTNLHHPYKSTRPCKIQANAIGFASTPVTKETTSKNKNSNNNNNNDYDEELPEVVFDKLVVRVLVSVGVPLGGGIALLYIFGALKSQQIWDVPIWLPFVSTFLTFGASAFGLAYGSLSTSLDPDKKGSVLGWEEAKENWFEMWKEDDK